MTEFHEIIILADKMQREHDRQSVIEVNAKQALEDLIALKHDSVKYPQLKLPDMQMERVDRAIRRLSGLGRGT
jgi:hypothetical protein